MKLKLTLEYDGTEFRGWARQPGERTVESVFREACDAIFPTWSELDVAGRTDTGVHAVGQVVSLEVGGGPPPDRIPRALTARLPEDVAVVAAEAVEAGFSARYSASSRTYRYRILRRRIRSPFEARRSLWWPRPLDEDALGSAAALLPGEHDFTAFTPAETQHTSLPADRVRRGLGASSGRAALHDHRKELSPAHGADARRHDARTESGRAPAAARGPSSQRRRRHRAGLGPVSRARPVRLASSRCGIRSSSSISTGR